MSHFENKTSSPIIVMSIAYLYIVIVGIVLYATGFYEDSTFFNWGPPIKFFNHSVVTEKEFYSLHLLIFVHQLVNNCVNSIVYPWIINSIQDPKNKNLEYSRWVSLILVNAFNIYSELDLVFIIVGFMSQISFVMTICLANAITSTYINNNYIKEKDRDSILSTESYIDLRKG